MLENNRKTLQFLFLLLTSLLYLSHGRPDQLRGSRDLAELEFLNVTSPPTVSKQSNVHVNIFSYDFFIPLFLTFSHFLNISIDCKFIAFSRDCKLSCQVHHFNPSISFLISFLVYIRTIKHSLPFNFLFYLFLMFLSLSFPSSLLSLSLSLSCTLCLTYSSLSPSQ